MSPYRAPPPAVPRSPVPRPPWAWMRPTVAVVMLHVAAAHTGGFGPWNAGWTPLVALVRRD